MNVTPLQAVALVERLDALAADVGRLRRRSASNEEAWTGPYIVERLAQHVETVDAALQPSAGELVAAGFDVDTALSTVDARARRFRELLGEKTR